MTKLKNVKVEITLFVECNQYGCEELIEIIEEGLLNNKEYTLSVFRNTKYCDNTKAIYMIMYTNGSYEMNLKRLRNLHTNIEELLEGTSVEYKGISLIPNQVNWETIGGIDHE